MNLSKFLDRPNSTDTGKEKEHIRTNVEQPTLDNGQRDTVAPLSGLSHRVIKDNLARIISRRATSSLPSLTEGSTCPTVSVDSIDEHSTRAVRSLYNVRTVSWWDRGLVRSINEDIDEDVSHTGSQFEMNPLRIVSMNDFRHDIGTRYINWAGTNWSRSQGSTINKGVRVECTYDISDHWSQHPRCATEELSEGADEDGDTTSDLYDYESEDRETAIRNYFGSVKAEIASHILDSIKQLTLTATIAHQQTGGSSNQPTSSSANASNSTPPTTVSVLSGNAKRKLDKDDDEGEGKGEEGDGIPAVVRAKASKKRKPLLYDCPFTRKPPGFGHNNPGCAREGMEFRRLWQHLRTAHYRCDICGCKLTSPRIENQHHRARLVDPSVCQLRAQMSSEFEIGYTLFAALESIYDNRDKDQLQITWAAWWCAIFPGHGSAPEGTHQGTITFPSAEINNVAELVQREVDDMLNDQSLPPMDPAHMTIVLRAVDNAIRSWNFARRGHLGDVGNRPNMSVDQTLPEESYEEFIRFPDEPFPPEDGMS